MSCFHSSVSHSFPIDSVLGVSVKALQFFFAACTHMLTFKVGGCVWNLKSQSCHKFGRVWSLLLFFKDKRRGVLRLSLKWIHGKSANLCFFTCGFSSTFPRNRAIADYLRSNGYEEAYSTFKKEAVLDMVGRGRHTRLSTRAHTRGFKEMWIISGDSLFL